MTEICKKRKVVLKFSLTNHGRVAELVYARDSKSRSRKGLRVRLPPRPPENLRKLARGVFLSTAAFYQTRKNAIL